MDAAPAALRDIVTRRIDTDPSLDTSAGLLLLAALDSDEAFEHELGGIRPSPDEATGSQSGTGAPDARTPACPTGAFLTGVTVEGFRGIGPARTLPVAPGPGLTLVCGRNGSGKSSFAEAVEIALTGVNERWAAAPSKDWREGWRNLHHAGPTRIALDLLVESTRPATLTVTRTWADDAGLEDAVAAVTRPGQCARPLDTLGWDAALATNRPFLSYSDLGRVLSGKPSDLHDALWGLLGLESLVQAQNRLTRARRDIKTRRDTVTEEAKRLRADAEALDDDRAVTAARLLAARTRDLAALAALASTASDGSSENDAVARLRALAALAAPSPETMSGIVADLRAALDARAAASHTNADRAARLADLLDRTLTHHHTDGDQPCPVCGNGTLDARWRAEAQARLTELRVQAEDVRQAEQLLETAVTRARQEVHAPPQAMIDTDGLGLTVPPDLCERWAQLADLPSDPTALAEHLDTLATPVHTDATALATAAREELQRREDRWLPLAGRLAAWLETAHAADAEQEIARRLDEAITWLRSTTGDIANERLSPLAEQSAAIWERLRQESNVSLGPITLAGTATRRRVTLDVTVDGYDASALGVMSQGEVHALALSLFLPRATLPSSPFRFLVIDDPVQAMDPSKVDGLAMVLTDIATRHQVVVFTHDDRLPNAVRDLGLPATILRVSRRDNSVVEITPSQEPAKRALHDARALLHDDEIDDAVAARVVPGLCRTALERACLDTVRRRRLAKGHRLEDIEKVLADTTRLRARLALALFDDADRETDLNARPQHINSWALATVKLCNEGAHGPIQHSQLRALVDHTDALMARIGQ